MIHRHFHNGFTLIEMSIVLVIVALLIGGLLAPLSTQKEQERRTENDVLMERAREALIGFAIVNGRLPCPDTDVPTDGLENGCAAGVTAFDPNSGTLPWVTLGLDSGLDPWGFPVGYVVNGAFANPALSVNAPFPLAIQGTSTGILRVSLTRPADCTDDSELGTVAENVPAVLWSGGKTSYGSNDESENTNGDRCFVEKPYNTTTGNEFDDQVIWLSPNILFNRMVSAGVLP
ncbi:MAG: type II secretion system protein [Thiogranum sp.]